MVNTIKWEDQPYLFDNIEELFKEHTNESYCSRGWVDRRSIIEFRIEHWQHYPDVLNFEDYVGTWETNEYSVYNADPSYEVGETIYALYRVEKVTKVIETTIWERVK